MNCVDSGLPGKLENHGRKIGQPYFDVDMQTNITAEVIFINLHYYMTLMLFCCPTFTTSTFYPSSNWNTLATN